MIPSTNLFLVGLMGAGKTTIGRLAARRLAKRFIDSDREIERRCGVGIPVIFEVEGEDGFRAREAAVLDELSVESNIVLATGGGAVLRAETRARLAERGTVVYLKARPEDLARRIGHDRNRPLLAGRGALDKLRELEAIRDPLYREVADLIIETGAQSAQSLAGDLVDLVERKWKQSA